MFDLEALSNTAARAAQRVVSELAGKLATAGDAAALDQESRAAWLAAGEVVVGGFVRELARQQAATRRCDCPECGKPARFKQMRPCTVRTVLTGQPTEVPSPYFVCSDCKRGVLGLRVALGLDADGFTRGLREMSVRAGVLEPFESAAEEVLGRLAGVSVSGSKIHDLCQASGERACKMMDDGCLGTLEPVAHGGQVVVQLDGGMLRIDGEWREAKLGIVYPLAAVSAVSKDRRMLAERPAVSTLGDPESLGRVLYPAVEAMLPKDADGRPHILGNVHVLGDGAVWIAKLIDEILPGARYLLDWYHAAEPIAQTALALFDDEGARRRWSSHQKNLLMTGRVSALLRGLARETMQRKAGSEAQERLSALHRYFNERSDQLWYAEARRKGLPIGSGVVESANSHVLQQRMKRNGMRWTGGGARAMAALRCAYRSTGGMDALFAA